MTPVPPQDGPLDLLYVVYDRERVVVALDLPPIEGAVEEAAFGNVETVELVTDNDPELADARIRDEAPGRRGTRARYGTAAVAGLVAGTAVSVAATAALGIPLAAVALVGAVVGYRRRAATLAESWQRNHRVLTRDEDVEAFNAARAATERIVDAWPHLGALAGTGDPGPALARSLWNLSEFLVARSALRDKHEDLVRARTDLPPGTELADEVADRLAQVAASLAAVQADIDVRLDAFEGLAERCARYLREEQAIARARAAVRGADQALSEPGPLADIALEPGNELAERTRAVLDAYRELTGGSY
jgi:hypothetical protein